MEDIIDAEKERPAALDLQIKANGVLKARFDQVVCQYKKLENDRNAIRKELYKCNSFNQDLLKQIAVLENTCELYEKIIAFIIEKCE